MMWSCFPTKTTHTHTIKLPVGRIFYVGSNIPERKKILGFLWIGDIKAERLIHGPIYSATSVSLVEKFEEDVRVVYNRGNFSYNYKQFMITLEESKTI